MKQRGLKRCQVETPPQIVDLVWKHALRRRAGKFEKVLDLGAGDGRFGNVRNRFGRYLGIELDSSKTKLAALPKNAKLNVQDAFELSGDTFDLCIGNPPYIKHHDLGARWHARVLRRIQSESGVKLKATANAFVLFLMQALLRTKPTGLVVQLVPYEWVSRPSACELRKYISDKRWNVHVYRFSAAVFPRVLTTASITVIDKSSRAGKWTFGEIGTDGKERLTIGPSGSRMKVLSYAQRATSAYALRGLSPGGQEIFVLTEERRLALSLKKKRDVVPCVASLRNVPSSLEELNEATFQDHYIDAGKPCWLIRSHAKVLSSELGAYIKHIGDAWKAYSTCTERVNWWRYKPHPAPDILLSSGFVGRAPKIVVNAIGAIAVGAVYGVFVDKSQTPKMIVGKLSRVNFRSRVVGHSNNLKKLEVRQLNGVLADIT
jgi:hypothetical protein